MATIRALDRRRSAALRAVGADPQAELRGTLLRSTAGTVDLASPYLTLLASDDPRVQRGIADALALVLRHSDPRLHRTLRPDAPLERVVFDVLEQLRCQSLAPELPGVRHNLGVVTNAWCRNARAQGVAESGVGLLVYTLTHMARARLGLGLTDEEVDSIIEAPRARLGRLVGHALKRISETRTDQRAFAKAALEMARLISEMAADTTGANRVEAAARYRMLVPPEWVDGDHASASGVATGGGLGEPDDVESLTELGGYRVFADEFDVVLAGADLYRAERLRTARAKLDELVRAQSVSSQRLALRYRKIFATPTPTEWRFGLPEGQLDRRRLAQMAAQVDARTLFRQARTTPTNNTAVALLLDNSGSMKAHRFETLAVLADTLSRALDQAGVTNEVLGHTTNSWTGGRAMQAWRGADKPDDPGRVAELAHIIYKDAEQPWRRARRSLAALLVTRHFRESVDGEAVAWAHGRLVQRPEPRKILVVVSDGAPAESATQMANSSTSYLTDHLARVVRQIEQRSVVEIAALTIGGDVSSVFANSVAVDLDTTLTLGTYASLEALFASRSRHSSRNGV